MYAKLVGKYAIQWSICDCVVQTTRKNDPKNESGNCLVVMFSRQVCSCSQKNSSTPSKRVSTYPMDAILNTLDDMTF